MNIYENNPGGLTATGNRSVSTFPSGLCRIDRTYVCRSSSAAVHRETLAVGNSLPGDDGSPGIDGAYIFPAPQEVNRSDGFTEFHVSAFCRDNEEGLIEYKWKFFSTSEYGLNGIAKNKTKKVTQVVLTKGLDETLGAAVNELIDETGATKPTLVDGNRWSLSGWDWTLGPVSFESVNFGKFTEITYVIDAYKFSA